MFRNQGYTNYVRLLTLAGATFLAQGLFAAESFRVTLHRESMLGASVVKPGDYKVTVDGDKAQFKMGKEVINVNVKEEKLEAKARRSYVRYQEGGMGKIVEVVVEGKDCRWVIN